MRRAGLHRLLCGAAIACATLASGCRLGSAAARSVTGLFASPQPVKKIKQPVRKDARLAVLWIGHASALVQIDDKFILTDPVFTSTVGQFSKRLVEPGIDPADLPPIDATLISHVHFDHLSLGSLDMIEKRIRTLILPKGGTAYLTDFAFPTYELRTWQAWEKDGLRVTAVPVAHVGYRYGIDNGWMTESFTGYVIEYHGIKVYFGGDTAYDQKLFLETGERFPGIELALMPIGPIEPHDFMREYHMDPAEAFQAFIDLDATTMVPVHYDTFINSTDDPGDALRLLKTARDKTRLPKGRDVAPIGIGEQRVFLKLGEGPTPKAPEPPPSSSPPPAPSTPAAPKSDIPDDFRLD